MKRTSATKTLVRLLPLVVIAIMWQYPLSNRLLWLAVSVPETELIRQLGGTNNVVPALVTAIGFILFVVTVLTARKYRPSFVAHSPSNTPTMH